MELGKLEKVDLRNIWKHEASDFSSWLSKSENLSMLSDEIGMDITLIQTEASVGKFSVDILAEEEDTGRKVVIENQLELTNHDHLGKIITYASGFDAEIIIWIVKEVRDEHKQAVDWLNEHTDEKINIFAIEMEVWKIGGSLYAPKFKIVSKPNDWAKAIKKTTSQNELSDTKLLQLEFWNKFKEFAQEQNTNISLRKANPQHWFNISIGTSGAKISLTVNSQSDQIGCEIYISNDKDLFYELEKYKENIHKELGFSLDWMELPIKKASRIKLTTDGDISTSEEWNEYFQWCLSNAESFQKVFVKYIKKIRQ